MSQVTACPGRPAKTFLSPGDIFDTGIRPGGTPASEWDGKLLGDSRSYEEITKRFAGKSEILSSSNTTTPSII